jgi:hypothetical protein
MQKVGFGRKKEDIGELYIDTVLDEHCLFKFLNNYYNFKNKIKHVRLRTCLA